MHTYIHAFLHTYIQTYAHTYTHTLTPTHVRMYVQVSRMRDAHRNLDLQRTRRMEDSAYETAEVCFDATTFILMLDQITFVIMLSMYCIFK